MPLEISIHSKAFAQVHRVVLDADVVTVGRSAKCDLQIPLNTISGHHMTLRRHGTEYLLEDMGSTNGTYVDGTRLTTGKPLLLIDGSQIQLLEVTIDVHVLGADIPVDAGFTLQNTSGMVRQLVEQALRNEQEDYAIHPSLRVEQGQMQGATFMLQADAMRVTVGASPSADFQIRADSVPLMWMALVRHGESFYVEMEPHTQLLRDGAPHDPSRALTSGEALTGYGVAFRFHDPLEGYLEQIEEEDLGPPPGARVEEASPPPPEPEAAVQPPEPQPEPEQVPESASTSATLDVQTPTVSDDTPEAPSSSSGMKAVLILFALGAIVLSVGVMLVLFSVI